MRNYIISAYTASIILLGITSCNREPAVSLAVDFSSRDIWRYAFTCDIGGTFSFADSIQDLSSTIECDLVGRRTETDGRLEVRAENVEIVSNILDEVEVDHVTNQITDASYSVALTHDITRPHDSLLVPLAGSSEWDLYRQLIKVLPSLPGHPVRPGFSWERQKKFPVTTSQGTADCEVYQSFTFDSIRVVTDNQKRAHVSWQFRYAIDDAGFDQTGAFAEMPLAGNGEGAAVIDIDNNKLVNADMVFTTPVCSLSQLTVQWEEKASLVLNN